jgi:hypothetical protein
LSPVDINPRYPGLLDDRPHGFADLEQNVVLDPVHSDYFTSKLLARLQAIGTARGARRRPGAAGDGQTGRAHAAPPTRRPRTSGRRRPRPRRQWRATSLRCGQPGRHGSV